MTSNHEIFSWTTTSILKLLIFGLAMLCNRENTHLTTTRGRGTPGYSAPELRMPNFSVIHKCDVYCFGMLLFEIIGRRRNLALNLSKARSGFQCGLEKV